MNYIEYNLLIIIISSLFGLGVAWSVGANDLANIMSTSIGSKAITVKQAIIIAIIFEFAGALLGGEGVARTISTGIINIGAIHDTHVLVHGMLAVLLAAATWLSLASFWGTPVSVTQTIVGSIVGFGMIVLGVHAIHWQETSSILISWVVSPSIAGVLAYLLFLSVQHLILGRSEPLRAAKRVLPIYLFLIGIVLAIMVVLKALHHFAVPLLSIHKIIITVGISFVILLIGNVLFRRVKYEPNMHYRIQFIYIEKMFGFLMLLTACAMVFAHGSNDVAIAMGPVVAVTSLMQSPSLHFQLSLYWIISAGCVGVVIGFLMYGRKVIMTVGSSITALTPSRAFCATLAAATTVVISTSGGIPVSATQTLVGAVLGVGLARGIGALDLGIIRNIFLSWMITIPVGAGLTIGFYYLLKQLF